MKNIFVLFFVLLSCSSTNEDNSKLSQKTLHDSASHRKKEAKLSNPDTGWVKIPEYSYRDFRYEKRNSKGLVVEYYGNDWEKNEDNYYRGFRTYNKEGLLISSKSFGCDDERCLVGDTLNSDETRYFYNSSGKEIREEYYKSILDSQGKRKRVLNRVIDYLNKQYIYFDDNGKEESRRGLDEY
jgi:hypothetical protein